MFCMTLEFSCMLNCFVLPMNTVIIMPSYFLSLATQWESACTIIGFFGNFGHLITSCPLKTFTTWSVLRLALLNSVFLTVIMPPFLALRGLRLLFNQPVWMITKPGVPTSSRLHAVYWHAVSQTPRSGAHAHTHKYVDSANLHACNVSMEHQASCEGVYLLCLNLCGWKHACANCACMHVLHAFLDACLCLLVVCVLKGERELVHYICMSLQPGL